MFLLECRLYFCLCDAGMVGRAPPSVRWTCLMMDLQFTLSVYLNRHYNHLKSIKLCANMVVKNMFTSDLLLDPGENQNFAIFFSWKITLALCFYLIVAILWETLNIKPCFIWRSIECKYGTHKIMWYLVQQYF